MRVDLGYILSSALFPRNTFFIKNRWTLRGYKIKAECQDTNLINSQQCIPIPLSLPIQGLVSEEMPKTYIPNHPNRFGVNSRCTCAGIFGIIFGLMII